MREHTTNPSKQTHRESIEETRIGKAGAPKSARGNQKNLPLQTETAKVMGAIFESTARAEGDSKHVGATLATNLKGTEKE